VVERWINAKAVFISRAMPRSIDPVRAVASVLSISRNESAEAQGPRRRTARTDAIEQHWAPTVTKITEVGPCCDAHTATLIAPASEYKTGFSGSEVAVSNRLLAPAESSGCIMLRCGRDVADVLSSSCLARHLKRLTRPDTRARTRRGNDGGRKTSAQKDFGVSSA
jgi:hypothetical protein